ncbi:protein LNK3 [Carya illinoinensis]|uniref:Protein LNK3 n=1 Tax=Carya illinoinensis TaxID=32201 RepID=A0A8T1NHK8_CARIL|nr:protein LNK3 [Carya illinoinensis]KAG6628373.1 hypothetical protein CIPAW_14G009500 [Carya illinoinensis]
MDWYFGSGINELVVPKYQELSDRLPSPDSWSKWGIGAFRSPNKCFVMDSNLKEQELDLDANSLCNEVELDAFHDKDQSSGSSICEGLSEKYFQRRSPSDDRPDSKLDDLAGFEQMNDIFLSSLLEDLPDTETIDESFYFSPVSQCGVMPGDNLDSQCVRTDANDTVGRPMHLKRNTFSSLMGWDNRDTTALQFLPCNSDQIDCPPVKGPFGEDKVSCEQHSMTGNFGKETSPEECVLQELEMVMAQLTEKTRICFRDALYRLAKNSKQHDMATEREAGYVDMEKPPPWTPHDMTMRTGGKKAMESETNAIDRAIANLMFNELNFSTSEHSSAASVNSSGGVVGDNAPPVNSKQNVARSTRPTNYSLNQPKIRHVPLQSISPDDAEVPKLAQTDLLQATNLHTDFSRNTTEYTEKI